MGWWDEESEISERSFYVSDNQDLLLTKKHETLTDKSPVQI